MSKSVNGPFKQAAAPAATTGKNILGYPMRKGPATVSGDELGRNKAGWIVVDGKHKPHP